MKPINSKGAIFAMDAMMAIIVVFLVIITARTQMAGTSLDYGDSAYAQKIGGDIVAVLDETGVLATLDESAIEGNISALLPASYQMWAEIESYTTNLTLIQNITAGSEPADDKSVVSSRRIFVSGDGYIERYNIIRFKVWAK